jgi:hypothetical protein
MNIRLTAYLLSLGKRFCFLVGSLLLVGCASTGTRVGAPSPLTNLGAPTMVQTTLGRLAVWDVGGNNLDAEPIVLWPSIFSDHV